MLARSGVTMNLDDVLLWPDGFWCFRHEFRCEFLRDVDENYRVILDGSDEWLSFERHSILPVHANLDGTDGVL